MHYHNKELEMDLIFIVYQYLVAFSLFDTRDLKN